eukprot:TRINITY_DN2298_c0_g2_i1.p1 TRINITY_DN2298_c0_g2~~TRINITY_DN2298_c0_g2_i1.p1  ORF type:complete len:307 (+),score=60.29 TRINITY_DN2298_c0_g2_i1:205-1125(+)
MDAVGGTASDRKAGPRKRKKKVTNTTSLHAETSSQPTEGPSKKRTMKKRRRTANPTNSETLDLSSTLSVGIGTASSGNDSTADLNVQHETLRASGTKVSTVSLSVVDGKDSLAIGLAAETIEASAKGDVGSLEAGAEVEGADPTEEDGGPGGGVKTAEEDAGLSLEERRALKRKAKKARREAELLEKNLKDKEDAFTSNERKVFVGGINDEADVRKKFGKCGKFEFFSFPPGKGIAFITFTTEKGMLAALELDGTGHKGRTINVKIATHQKKISSAKGKSKGKGKGKDKGKTKGKGGSSKGLRTLS